MGSVRRLGLESLPRGYNVTACIWVPVEIRGSLYSLGFKFPGGEATSYDVSESVSSCCGGRSAYSVFHSDGLHEESFLNSSDPVICDCCRRWGNT